MMRMVEPYIELVAKPGGKRGVEEEEEDILEVNSFNRNIYKSISLCI